jgi:ABC-type antimicrobial peptide transport system permease subunit
MFQNYFKIALRNLWRHKLHSIINVVGLAIGISACLAIFQIVKYELSFDKSHPDSERIYRIYTEFSGVFEGTNPGVSTGLPAALQEESTGTEAIARLHTFNREKVEIRNNNAWKTLKEQENIVITSPAYFDIFSSYEWLSGSPEASLAEPFQVVLAASKAKLYFGTENPEEVVGQEIRYADSLRLTVSGIVKDFEQPSDLTFTDFISLSTIDKSWLQEDIPLNNWENTTSSSQVFIKKMAGTADSSLVAQFKSIYELNKDPDGNPNWIVNYKLQPFSDLHFNGALGIFDSSRRPAHMPTLYALMVIAGILLVIASINFINLATAQALQRGREVGVRKVLGGTRQSLMFQFLGETLIVTTIAVVLSIGLAQLALGFFEEFLPPGLELELFDPITIAFLMGTIAVVTLLSGAYPAFILSSFLPVLALKNQTKNNRGSNSTIWIRKGLIVTQFTVSLVLIIGSLIIGNQIDYLLSKDMGFQRDAIVYFYAPWDYPNEKKQVLKNELSRVSAIEKLSLHQGPPARDGWSTSIFKFKKDGEERELNVHRKSGDEQYTSLYGIKLVAGRQLMPADTVREYLVNETMVTELGFQSPEEALGFEIATSSGPKPIVGVVKDFHHLSLKHEIEPLAVSIDKKYSNCFSLKLGTAGKEIRDFEATIDEVESIWREVYPNEAFEFTFFDESIEAFYKEEQRVSKLMKTATGIAIFISCIGLFGLVSFTVVQRTKEIGIRKVLGASVANIVVLLSRDFFWLVLVAILVGSPIAWLLANDWLADFAYRIDTQWWIFAAAGVIAVALALATVSIQAIRAAVANPVESLRDE